MASAGTADCEDRKDACLKPSCSILPIPELGKMTENGYYWYCEGGPWCFPFLSIGTPYRVARDHRNRIIYVGKDLWRLFSLTSCLGPV